MSTDIKKVKSRVAWISGGIYLMLAIVLGRLYYVSLAQGPELRKKSRERLIERKTIEAKRGDIFSADGKTLATTKPVYRIFFDPVTVDEELFNENVEALGTQLATLNSKYSGHGWASYLREQRILGHRYVNLANKLNFSELQRIRQYPILNKGKNRGGLIIEQDLQRIQMATNFKMRTIGYDLEGASAGLEGYYSEYLKGKPGSRLKQKIAGGDWKPIDDPDAVEPVDGFDVYTTIDTRIQDVAQQSLLRQLKKYKAEHGCAVVMEVATGKIVAMANLGRNKDSTYSELRNYAVWEATEPGSTMKLLSTMALLENGIADTSTKVDTHGGKVKIEDRYVRDSKAGGYGKISLKKAFEVSSNTAIVQLVYEGFKDNPSKFVDFLYARKFDQKTGVSIKGESDPTIPKPGDPNWSGVTMPWMAYGYSVSFTPLQLLTIYNAVANEGVMVQPQVVDRIMDHGRVIETFEPKVLHPSICSKETRDKLKDLLEGVVERGTAKRLYDRRMSLAGKTGTCQLNYWKKGSNDYQSSFAGYFPADRPQYSCVVVISEPVKSIGYYGAVVAGPVFKSIADEVYSKMPQEAIELDESMLALNFDAAHSLSPLDAALQKNYVPNLKGLDARELMSIVTPHGIKVFLEGSGHVVSQEPAVGASLNGISELKVILR